MEQEACPDGDIDVRVILEWFHWSLVFLILDSMDQGKHYIDLWM